MTQENINQIIRMAWEDRTTFEEIRKKAGLTEAEVIKVMRYHLKPSGFKRWRKRVSGRLTKHQGKFRESRRILNRVTTRDLLDREE